MTLTLHDIVSITMEAGDWDKRDPREHYKDLVIMSARPRALRLSSLSQQPRFISSTRPPLKKQNLLHKHSSTAATHWTSRHTVSLFLCCFFFFYLALLAKVEPPLHNICLVRHLKKKKKLSLHLFSGRISYWWKNILSLHILMATSPCADSLCWSDGGANCVTSPAASFHFLVSTVCFQPPDLMHIYILHIKDLLLLLLL